MDWRIRQNELAHSPKWTSACMIHHTCVYIRVGWGLLRLGTLSRGLGPPGRIYTHLWCIMHALVHFGECANPFWRMRQSFLSNAPIYFSACLEVFGYSGIQVSRVQHNNNNNNNGALVARGGSGKVVSNNQTQHTKGQEKRRALT